ncbi:MAG: tetratricopeptide repeat protein [Bacteroidia bacterium]|nr:tetratricopeptide repeat protein [Bacteroidia bacterium]
MIKISEAFCCLNEYNVNARGEVDELYEGLPVFYRSFDVSYSRAFVNSFDLTQKESIHYQKLSDVAFHLTRLKRFDEALSLLKWLHHRHPSQYQIMANLGTLYELTGNVDSAYYFIEQSMKINPDAHGGSEWVHLAVLRAKQQMQRNPNWIYQHQVLNLGLTDTVAQHSEQYEEILKKIWDISHQMEERIPFSPEPDLIVANIMRELGQLLETHVSIKDAYIAYRIAQVYDPLNSLNCIQKSEALLPLLIEHELSGKCKRRLKNIFPLSDHLKVYLKSIMKHMRKNCIKSMYTLKPR